jgi:hypothetical protein
VAPPTNGLKVSTRASRTPWIAVYHGVRGLVHTYGQKILSSRRVVQFDVAELTAVVTIDRIAQNTTLARARFAGTPSSRFHRERAAWNLGQGNAARHVVEIEPLPGATRKRLIKLKSFLALAATGRA